MTGGEPDEQLAGGQEQAAAKCPHSTRVLGATRNAAGGQRGSKRHCQQHPWDIFKLPYTIQK